MTSYGDVTRSSALLAYIELTASDTRLGVSVVGYAGDGGLYVGRLLDGSVASPTLQPGDKINSVNGHRLAHLDNDRAFRLLRATVAGRLGGEHTLRLGIIRSRDVGVLRHWQRWTDDDDVTAMTSSRRDVTAVRPTAVVQGLHFTTTRF